MEKITATVSNFRPHSRNVMPSVLEKNVSSFIYFDHLGPFDFPAGQKVHIPYHPHSGIATISYMFEGEGYHKDSLGNDQILDKGRLNYMISGNGIFHSEGLSDEFSEKGGRLCGFQIWHLLSSNERNGRPSFQTIPNHNLEKMNLVGGIIITALLGKYEQISSPIQTERDIILYTIRSNKEAFSLLKLNKKWEYLISVCDGVCKVNDIDLSLGKGFKISYEEEIYLYINNNCKAVLMGGPPINEIPIFNGSLVSVGEEQMKDYYRRLANSEFRKNKI